MSEYEKLSAGREARPLSQIMPVMVSIEDRIEHLQKAVSRLSALRMKLDDYLEGLAPNGLNETSKGSAPPSAGISGRLGDEIASIHTHIDQLESIARRFGEVLFSQAAKPVRG